MYYFSNQSKVPWNKGKLIGQKLPFKQQDIWAIRVKLQLDKKTRDLALFNLAIDSKLRGCDLVRLKVSDVAPSGEVASRASIVQKKTGQPVQFEITDVTREALTEWIKTAKLKHYDFIFKSRIGVGQHIKVRQYARIVKSWVAMAGLEPSGYGTHSLRRTKATLIYKKTKNIRAIQLLLGHTKLESTIKYLGIEVDDALEISEHIEI